MDGTVQILVYSVADCRFGLPLDCVERVYRAAEVTPLHQAPRSVAGVIDVAGMVIPVISMRRKLHLDDKEMALDDRMVLVRTSSRAVMLWVDSVEEVIELPLEKMTTGSRILPGFPHAEGVLQVDEDLLVVHDLDDFLTLEEQRAHDNDVLHG